VTTVVDYKRMIELMLAAAAKVCGVFFKKTKSDVINSQDNTDTKHCFAEYNKKHESGIPFAWFQ
jgi:hypothetical protein